MNPENVTQIVPEAPKETKHILRQCEQRLQLWKDHFASLSSRIKIKLPTDDDFKELLVQIEVLLRRHKGLEDNVVFVGFPKKEMVGLVILIDSSSPGEKSVYLLDDIKFFCFNNIAFGITYFAWDGDPEECNFTETYSLASYSKSALSWKYVASLVSLRISELEERVPILKTSS